VTVKWEFETLNQRSPNSRFADTFATDKMMSASGYKAESIF
jgi:hypothetical protein